MVRRQCFSHFKKKIAPKSLLASYQSHEFKEKFHFYLYVETHRQVKAAYTNNHVEKEVVKNRIGN